MLKSSQQRGDYALHRMSLAIERVLGSGSKEEKLQAVVWLGVWQARHAVFLGGKLRVGSQVPALQPWMDSFTVDDKVKLNNDVVLERNP